MCSPVKCLAPITKLTSFHPVWGLLSARPLKSQAVGGAEKCLLLGPHFYWANAIHSVRTGTLVAECNVKRLNGGALLHSARGAYRPPSWWRGDSLTHPKTRPHLTPWSHTSPLCTSLTTGLNLFLLVRNAGAFSGHAYDIRKIWYFISCSTTKYKKQYRIRHRYH